MVTLKQYKYMLSLFSVFALAVASFFTVCHMFDSMPVMNMSNQMSTGLSMSASPSCCQNTGMDHNLHFSMVETLTKNINFNKALLGFSLSLIVWVILGAINSNKLFKSKFYYSRYREYWFNNYILTALTRGILQPKLYNI